MNADKLILQAYEAIMANDFEMAIDRFKQAILMDPDNATYHYKLSITCTRSNRLAEAFEHAQIAALLNPSDETFAIHMNNLRARKLLVAAAPFFSAEHNQVSSAVPLLKQAVGYDPLCLEAYLMLGLALRELHRYNEAIQAFQEVLRLDPQHETAQYYVYEGKGERFESKN